MKRTFYLPNNILLFARIDTIIIIKYENRFLIYFSVLFCIIVFAQSTSVAKILKLIGRQKSS